MPGQDNSVCPVCPSEAEIACGDSNDDADDKPAWPLDGRDGVSVRLVRHGRRIDPDRRAAHPDAAAVGDGAARDHADGVQWLARLSLAPPHLIAGGWRVSDRMR